MRPCSGLPAAGGMLGRLAEWQEAGWLRRIDLELARFLATQVEEQPAASRDARSLDLVLLAAALCSWQLGRGHSCLVLSTVIRAPEMALSMAPAACTMVAGLDPDAWQRACADWPELVCLLPAAADAQADGSEPPDVRPLILQDGRLYLWRYWQYEQQVQAAILARLRQPGMLGHRGERQVLEAGLAALFPPAPAGQGTPARPDWQKIACALAARYRFGLITGGPGTGKTTTVVRLLALLQLLARQSQGRFLQIGLAAPTGKAAARLNSSISGAIETLPLERLPDGEAIRQAIPSSVQTLHRLLGSRRDSRHFRHDARHPLPLDVLVIDEASMVDLDLMAKVVAALRAEARLILLGDKDQLASVEAGAILGELCARAQDGHYWPDTVQWVADVCGERIADELQDAGGRLLDQGIAMLRHSHRFRADSGIGMLADRVNRGNAEGVRQLWQQVEVAQGGADIRRIVLLDPGRSGLRQLVTSGWTRRRPAGGRAAPGTADAGGLTAAGQSSGVDPSAVDPAAQMAATDAAVGYAHYLRQMQQMRPAGNADAAAFDAWAAGVLAAHGRFQLLCALRQGPWGVLQMNQQIAHWLQQRGLISASEGWYPGRPVIVTRNDYELGLMNGDVGIALSPDGIALRVAFPGAADPAAIRWILPSRLQAVETVFAMTVHKAQGSEFDHAALVMPAELSPVLTRELVYTAITRARRFFTLCGAQGLDEVFGATVRRRVLRASGLMRGQLASIR